MNLMESPCHQMAIWLSRGMVPCWAFSSYHRRWRVGHFSASVARSALASESPYRASIPATAALLSQPYCTSSNGWQSPDEPSYPPDSLVPRPQLKFSVGHWSKTQRSEHFVLYLQITYMPLPYTSHFLSSRVAYSRSQIHLGGRVCGLFT